MTPTQNQKLLALLSSIDASLKIIAKCQMMNPRTNLGLQINRANDNTVERVYQQLIKIEEGD